MEPGGDGSHTDGPPCARRPPAPVASAEPYAPGMAGADEDLHHLDNHEAEPFREPEPELAVSAPAGLLALIGVMEGPADLAERHDHYVAERMRRRYGDLG